MSTNGRWGKVSIIFFLWGSMGLWWLSVAQGVSAKIYDFDEGIEAITAGLISENREILKNKRIAVFGIIESISGEKWAVSSHIEDGIVDALVKDGYRVIERRRIRDVIQKEIKKSTDLWFDQARVAQFGQTGVFVQALFKGISKWNFCPHCRKKACGLQTKKPGPKKSGRRYGTCNFRIQAVCGCGTESCKSKNSQYRAEVPPRNCA